MNAVIKNISLKFCLGFIILVHCGTSDWKTAVENLLKVKQYEIASALLDKSAKEHQNSIAYHLFKLELLSISKPIQFKTMQQEADWIKNNIDPEAIVQAKKSLYSLKNNYLKFYLSQILYSTVMLDKVGQNAYERSRIDGLDDENMEFRLIAIKAVGKIERENTDGLILILDKQVNDSLSEAVRVEAALAMSENLKCDNGYEAAKKALKSENIINKSIAIRSLGLMSNTNIKRLLKPFLKNKDPFVQVAAIGALHMQNMNVNYRPLLANLKGKDRKLKYRSLQALKYVKFKTVPDEVKNQLRSESKLNRILASQIIGKQGNTKDGMALKNALNTEYDMDCRIELITALGKLRDKNNAYVLINYLGSSSDLVQFKAALALGEIGRGVIPEMIDSLKSTSRSTLRKNLMLFLIQGNVRESSPQFYEIYLNDPKLYTVAAHGLMEFKDSTIVPSLIDSLTMGDKVKRYFNITILDSIGDQRAIPYLLRVEEPKDLRIHAEKAVKSIRLRNKIIHF